MRLGNVFTFVIAAHALLAVLFLQPGCQRSPASPEPTAEATIVGDPMSEGELDPAFNANLPPVEPAAPREGRFAPRRPMGTDGWVTNEPEAPTGQPLEPLAPLNPSSPPLAASSGERYTIVRGDSLWSISQKLDVSLQALLDVNGLTRESVIYPGEELVVPSAGGARSMATAAPSGTTTYSVAVGDTLSEIAAAYGTSTRELQRLNDLDDPNIFVGQTLVVPADRPERTRRPQETLSSDDVHIVSRGETPGQIAARYGMTAQALMELNEITDPRSLQVGQVLRITAASTPEPASTAIRPRREPPPDRQESVLETAPTLLEDEPVEDEVPLIPVDEQ